MGFCEPQIESYGDHSRHEGLSGAISLAIAPSPDSDRARALLVLVDLQAYVETLGGKFSLHWPIQNWVQELRKDNWTVPEVVVMWRLPCLRTARFLLLTPTFVRPYARVV